MARIPYPERRTFPPELREMFEQLPDGRNGVLDMLSHSPALAMGVLRQSQAQFTELELSPRRRELVILTVARFADCEYVYRQHVAASRAEGVEDELRESLWSGSLDASMLPDDDRALMAFVEAVVRSPHVSDEVLKDVRAHLSDREVVEVVRVIGHYWSVARICTVLEVEIETPPDQSSIDAVANLR